MSEFHYEPLTYLDASFLALETRNSHMHVAGVALFDAAPLKGDDGGADIAPLRRPPPPPPPPPPRPRAHPKPPPGGARPPAAGRKKAALGALGGGRGRR